MLVVGQIGGVTQVHLNFVFFEGEGGGGHVSFGTVTFGIITSSSAKNQLYLMVDVYWTPENWVGSICNDLYS